MAKTRKNVFMTAKEANAEARRWERYYAELDARAANAEALQKREAAQQLVNLLAQRN